MERTNAIISNVIGKCRSQSAKRFVTTPLSKYYDKKKIHSKIEKDSGRNFQGHRPRSRRVSNQESSFTALLRHFRSSLELKDTSSSLLHVNQFVGEDAQRKRNSFLNGGTVRPLVTSCRTACKLRLNESTTVPEDSGICLEKEKRMAHKTTLIKDSEDSSKRELKGFPRGDRSGRNSRSNWKLSHLDRQKPPPNRNLVEEISDKGPSENSHDNIKKALTTFHDIDNFAKLSCNSKKALVHTFPDVNTTRPTEEQTVNNTYNSDQSKLSESTNNKFTKFVMKNIVESCAMNTFKEVDVIARDVTKLRDGVFDGISLTKTRKNLDPAGSNSPLRLSLNVSGNESKGLSPNMLSRREDVRMQRRRLQIHEQLAMRREDEDTRLPATIDPLLEVRVREQDRKRQARIIYEKFFPEASPRSVISSEGVPFFVKERMDLKERIELRRRKHLQMKEVFGIIVHDPLRKGPVQVRRRSLQQAWEKRKRMPSLIASRGTQISGPVRGYLSWRSRLEANARSGAGTSFG